MSARRLADPYLATVRALNRVGVQYVVIGMSGINYYAQRASEAIATMDYDLFVNPTLPNVQKAVHQLSHLGFSLATSDGPFDTAALRALVRARRALIATTPDGLMVELFLAVSGYLFAALVRDAVTITIQGTPVKVGRLSKLLRSKQLAGRLKDRQFLKRYQALLVEEVEPRPGIETRDK